MKLKRHSHFLRNMLIFVGIIIIIMVLFLIRLWNYLADYQATLPAALGDTVLIAYRTYDTLYLRQHVDNIPSTFDDDFVYMNYLRKYIDHDSFYYYESSSSSDNEIEYTYLSTGKPFAKLTLKANGEYSKYHFPIYEISSLEQFSQESYQLTQGASTTILFDGNPIDPQYETSSQTEAERFSDIGLGPYETKTFEVPDTVIGNDIKAIDSSGNSCSLVWDDTYHAHSINDISEDICNEISDFTLKACQSYAVFATVKNASRDNVLSYLYPDTAFYQAIKSFDTTYGIAKTSDSFKEVNVSDIKKYSETEYTCQVYLQYEVVQNSVSKEIPLSFTCYVTHITGEWKLLSLVTN